MAFSSRRGGSGWVNSLLPSTAAKSTSKQTRSSLKPRRRTTTAFRDFILSNFFTIGLLFSLFLFLFLLFRFGVPRPHQFRAARSRFPRSRKPVIHKSVNDTVLTAAVDITTKELYDKIQFLDEDGGPWKQGWKVTYKGSEWNNEKLKVFVVPHSHNDPGWKLTVEEYYDRQSRHILDTIVETLSKDNRRKFIWEEMSYLERWWRDASDVKKESFINLVQNGQLEIVGGGWVMNDEITEGNMWLNETVGVIPRNSWSIDPFGYSSTMAYLLRRMGFENMLIQRTHYELKKELSWHKNLEYVWRQSWDADETTDIFVHMMPFYSYDIPHTCGPEPAVCCQFDFARMRGFVYELCPWGEHPVETNQENVKERAYKLLDQYKKKSTLYRTNTLLVPLGDDFRYISIDEAEAQFRNYQLLFDYINSDPSLNAEANFGTLDDYFRTLREEADRINYSRPGEIGSDQIGGFPSLSGDFFTYADRNQDYWSGYYVSRPFFKAVDRVLEQTLRGAEMMMAFLLGYCQKPQCEKLPTGFSYKLTAARRNLALFQHHDGVTGTGKDHVVEDYGTRMHMALQDLQIFMSKAIEVLLGIHHEKNDHNPAQFEPAQLRSKYNAQPVHRAISLHEGTVQTVVIFNPLEQMCNEVVMLVVVRPDVTVLDSNWTCVKSQISPELHHDKNKMFTGKHRVYWKASIPALGLQTYYIANGFVGCEKAKPARLRVFTPSNDLSCPAPYTCTKLESDTVEIRNQRQTLTFRVNHGVLQKISSDGHVYVVDEEIGMYSSTESGAYLFKPNGEAESIIQAAGQIVVSEGHLVQEVHSYPKTAWETSPISHSTRIYNGENTVQEFVIEKEYHVELLGNDFNDKELIARYKTNIDNRRVFYSDLNGFQMSRRETYDKIPLQGNYYPMPSLAFMQNPNGQRFSIHTRQSLGVASLKNGWLEIMLDRRLVRDDGRGLGQGVMDNRPMNVLFHILVESNISSSANLTPNPSPRSPSLLSHLVGAHLNYPLNVFIAKKPQEISVQPPPRSFSPLAASLPCDLHVMSFKVPQPLKYSQQTVDDSRFVLVLHRQHYDPSYCRKGRSQCSNLADEPVNLFDMFKGLAVLNAKPTSLNLLHEDTDMLGYDRHFGDGAQEGHVLISPMEIQAYKLQLRPHQ
ncbi:alpha-mannosidase 2 isoform X2 [Olea europaea var. sylvestris]|uniref:alpha-mannosidase 2 isoform X2 n=1 Tax=Olea europaea var. sylvestris TaxID=158386 RepID=UPI000C1D38B0|nr:alpha-mannosidase 2 isoform X2 [Olea europaea var. sylvestris]